MLDITEAQRHLLVEELAVLALRLNRQASDVEERDLQRLARILTDAAGDSKRRRNNQLIQRGRAS